MKNNKILISVIVVLICVANVYAQDWPQYLGPGRNSESTQKDILRSWPQNGPEVLWTVGIGIGYGGTVVENGKVYLLDRDDQVGDKIRCFDLSNGKELWDFSYEAPGSVMFPGSRSVPALDGNNIYTVGPYGDLYCVDINTHKPVWNTNIWTDYGGGEIPRWAITQCPLIYGDLVIVASQAPEAGVVAYEKATGKVKWTTPSLGATGYVSPIIIKVSDEDHVVMISASSGGGRGRVGSGGKVVGINPLTGKVLWEYGNWQCSIPVPSALDAGEGRMLIVGGYEAGAAMIKVEKQSDGGFNVEELFKTIEFGAHTKPPIFYKDHFYAQYSTNERQEGLVCMNMDGKIMWQTKRDPSFVRGSMILADGLILATDGAKTLYLVEPDPNAFKPVASAEILAEGGSQDQRFGAQNWAPIALADGKLLIRDQGQLMCVKVAGNDGLNN